MREVPVGRNAVALVDDEDYELVSQYRWYLDPYGYARGYTKGKGKVTLMHRLLLAPPADKQIDHINWNKLDNRRGNLRCVTASENRQNLPGAYRNSATGIRGVHFSKRYRRYVVRVGMNGRSVQVGVYTHLEDAAQAAAESRRSYMTHAAENRQAPSTTGA